MRSRTLIIWSERISATIALPSCLEVENQHAQRMLGPRNFDHHYSIRVIFDWERCEVM